MLLKIVTNMFLHYNAVDLSLDAMDSAGAQHLHITHNIFKRRIDLNGNPIDIAKKSELTTPTPKTVTNEVNRFFFFN